MSNHGLMMAERKKNMARHWETLSPALHLHTCNFYDQINIRRVHHKQDSSDISRLAGKCLQYDI